MNKLIWLPVLCIALAGCRKPLSPSVPIDPALALLVPSDTLFLAGVRLEPIRKTPLYKRYATPENMPPQLEQFIKETGLDPRKDLWEFLFVNDGKDTVAMVRGTFSEMGLEPRLEREGAKRTAYKGFTFIGDEKTAVAFINSSTAVAGRPQNLERIIDKRQQGVGIPKPLLDRISTISRENQAWFVHLDASRIPMLNARDSGDLVNLNNFIGKLQTLQGAIDLQNGAKIHLEGTGATPEDSKRLHDGLRGLVGLGRLNTPSDKRELLKVYDAIQIKQMQSVVTVDANLTMELIDELTKMITSLGLGSRSPGSSSRRPR